MPLNVTSVTAGGAVYGSPFVGPIDFTDTVRIDVSGMTSDEVDSDGYIKPGVPLKSNGTLCGSGETVYGIVIEPIKVAAGNAAGDLSGATDIDLAVATICQINQDIVEDNLGRALTSDELTGMPAVIIVV